MALTIMLHALMLQVGVRSLYLARRMKKIRGATLGHKSSVKTALQVVRSILNISFSYAYTAA